jgi:hypothetical protein
VSSPHRVAAAAGATLLAALTATVALAATQQTYSQKFTTKHPGKSSGMTFSAAASDPTGAPPVQAKRVVLTFPAGTRVNTGAVSRCVNASKCPAKSQIGSGQAVVLLGTAPQKLSVAAYNRAGGMVLAISNPLGAPVILKPTLSGSTLTLQIPSLRYGAVAILLTRLSLNIKQQGVGPKAYVRTPAACPKAGAWTFGAKFSYIDGTVTSLSSRSPCTAH